MKTKLEQVLDRYLNGREIAVWGNPTRSMLRELQPYTFHIADKVDPVKHYVLAVNEDDFNDFKADEQSKLFKYIDDFFDPFDLGGWLPFNWECGEAKIGRHSYFGSNLAQACKYGEIVRVGSFTAINETAYMDVNHQMNMTTVNDMIPFNDENKAKFDEKCLSDPKNPFGMNEKPLTIGNDVWIGANVFINGSTVTSIGDGAIIGAGAVVLEDVPPYAIVVGVPAKIKRYRYSPEMIETLLRVQWWDWSVEEINANADALMDPDVFMQQFGFSR
ncbi:MAG: CatB-related O-acetyltransferase [Defluviitaleaceae bacterium]|nr:CatB-related O-acetyltransferase [Defluviitaleaceae bacterium]